MKGLRFIVMSLSMLFSIAIAFAQKEANIWYFGYHAGLDFNDGSPVVLYDGKTEQTYSYASISDSNGNLLFYTDGATIYNKQHKQMRRPGLVCIGLWQLPDARSGATSGG